MRGDVDIAGVQIGTADCGLAHNSGKVDTLGVQTLGVTTDTLGVPTGTLGVPNDTPPVFGRADVCLVPKCSVSSSSAGL